MTDTATLETYLAEAEAALHKILVGKQATWLTHGDTSTKFNDTNIADLRAYIADLKGQLGLEDVKRTSARRIVFG